MTEQPASAECNVIIMDQHRLVREADKYLGAITADLDVLRKHCASRLAISSIEHSVNQLRRVVNVSLVGNMTGNREALCTMGLGVLIENILNSTAYIMDQSDVILVIRPVELGCSVYVHTPLLTSITELLTLFSQLLHGKGGFIELSAIPGRESVILLIEPLPYIEPDLIVQHLRQISNAEMSGLEVYSRDGRIFTTALLSLSSETGDHNGFQGRVVSKNIGR